MLTERSRLRPVGPERRGWRRNRRLMPDRSTIFVYTLVAAITALGFGIKTERYFVNRSHAADAAATSQPSPPPADARPAESKPGGTRPTTPAPEPARPQEETPPRDAPAALPPAPAEKTAPPINAK